MRRYKVYEKVQSTGAKYKRRNTVYKDEQYNTSGASTSFSILSVSWLSNVRRIVLLEHTFSVELYCLCLCVSLCMLLSWFK